MGGFQWTFVTTSPMWALNTPSWFCYTLQNVSHFLNSSWNSYIPSSPLASILAASLDFQAVRWATPHLSFLFYSFLSKPLTCLALQPVVRVRHQCCSSRASSSPFHLHCLPTPTCWRLVLPKLVCLSAMHRPLLLLYGLMPVGIWAGCLVSHL